MRFILKLSTFLLTCFFVIACNQSGENEAGSNQNAINTNTADSSFDSSGSNPNYTNRSNYL